MVVVDMNGDPHLAAGRQPRYPAMDVLIAMLDNARGPGAQPNPDDWIRPTR